MKIKVFSEKILNFLFPIECLVCGREDVWLCADCRIKIPLNDILGCLFCERKTKTGRTCCNCAAANDLDGIYIVSDYNQKNVSLLLI